MKKQFESVLVEQCAPTLASVKPANLFSYRPLAGEDIPASVSHWNRQLGARGVELFVLKHCTQTNTYLLYVCRRTQVDRILADAAVRDFLQQSGYAPSGDLNAYLQQLSTRLCLQADFPHEIGIFLGYPLDDVLGFIAHKGKDFTCCGHWKTYGDPVAAQKRFDQYKKCSSIYKRLYAGGRSIVQLTVAA